MTVHRRWTDSADARAAVVERKAVIIAGGLSIVYWAVKCALAARKLMWNDELYTYYIAHLPTMGDVWAALMSRENSWLRVVRAFSSNNRSATFRMRCGYSAGRQRLLHSRL